MVHVPSHVIAQALPHFGPGLLGDKAHSMVFDNSKVKRLVPDFGPRTLFADGARELVAWYDEDESRRVVDPELDALFDRLVERR